MNIICPLCEEQAEEQAEEQEEEYYPDDHQFEVDENLEWLQNHRSKRAYFNEDGEPMGWDH